MLRNHAKMGFSIRVPLRDYRACPPTVSRQEMSPPLNNLFSLPGRPPGHPISSRKNPASGRGAQGPKAGAGPYWPSNRKNVTSRRNISPYDHVGVMKTCVCSARCSHRMRAGGSGTERAIENEELRRLGHAESPPWHACHCALHGAGHRPKGTQDHRGG